MIFVSLRRPMDTSLDDTEVQDPSGSRRITVARSFADLERLCEPSLAYEASRFVKFTLSQFKATWEYVRTNHQDGNINTNVAMFRQALERFWVKLRDYSRMSIVQRVVHHRHLIKDIQLIHTGPDGLCEVLEASPDQKELVIATLKEEATAYVAALGDAIAEAFEMWKRDLRHYKATLMDEERVLDAAQGSKDPYKWSGNDMAQRTQRQIAVLVADAVRRQFDRPQWYIDPARVTWSEQSFARGSFASAHYGSLDNHKQVVIKRLQATRRSPISDATRAEFLKEVDFWAALRHPCVLTMWGACHDSDDPFMVCEYAAKYGTLANHLATPLGRKHFWRLLYEMALGIQYLHSKNIIHADLKLDNVFVADDGCARVADFGMSRVKVSAEVHATVPEPNVQSTGAMQWRARECVGANAVKPQLASDVYSFALCLIEAFVGGPPYGTLDHDSVAELIDAGTLPTIDADVLDRIPVDVLALIFHMTSRDPADRPTIQEVVAKLFPFVEAEESDLERNAAKDEPECVSCGAQLQSATLSVCPKCHAEVEGNQRDDTAPVTPGVESTADLPQLMQRLTSQSKPQKMSAMNAIMNCVSNAPTSISEVQKACAVSVLTQILKRKNEEDEVLRVALMALCVLVIGSSAATDQVVSEQAIPRLVEILTDGPSLLRGKAAKVLGALVYRNALLYHSTILARETVVAAVHQLGEDPSEKRHDKEDALLLLTTPPKDQAP